MSKMYVSAQLQYGFEVEVPDNIREEDILDYCDTADPVYKDLCRVMRNHNGEIEGYDGFIISIIDDETNETIYAM